MATKSEEFVVLLQVVCIIILMVDCHCYSCIVSVSSFASSFA